MPTCYRKQLRVAQFYRPASHSTMPARENWFTAKRRHTRGACLAKATESRAPLKINPYPLTSTPAVIRVAITRTSPETLLLAEERLSYINAYSRQETSTVLTHNTKCRRRREKAGRVSAPTGNNINGTNFGSWRLYCVATRQNSALFWISNDVLECALL